MKARYRRLACLAFAVVAAAARAWAADIYQLYIQPQPVEQALQRFAEQSGLQVVYYAGIARGRQANAVIGRFSSSDALTRLLADTGLAFDVVDANTVAIRLEVPGVSKNAGDQASSRESSRPFVVNQSDGQSNHEASGTRSDRPQADPHGKSRATLHESLNEVVVSARKRGEERSQDVPQSIVTFSSEGLQRFGIDRFDDYAMLVPSLSFINQGPGLSKIVVRGISTGFTRGDAPQDNEATGLYIDEAPIAINGSNPDFGLFDIERIEVLRGPQGTLYGAGAMSGNIRIITKQPRADRTEATVEGSISNTDDGDLNYNTNFALNLPLVEDKLALRMVGYHRFDDGFIDNVAAPPGSQRNVNSQSLFGGRLALKYLATDGLTVGMSVIQQRSTLGGKFNTNESEVSPVPLGEYEQWRLTEETTTDESTIVNLSIGYRLPWGEFVSSTSYAERELVYGADLTRLVDMVFGALSPEPLLPVGVRAPVSPTSNTSQVRDFVQEARLSGVGFGDRLGWLAGVFYSKRDRNFYQRLTSQGFEGLVREVVPDFDLSDYGAETLGDFDTVLDLDQSALFGEMTYDVTDRLEMTAGVRLFKVETTSDILFTGLLNGGTQNEVNDGKEDGVNPKFSLAYQFTDDVLGFATASKGFRVGGTNEIIANTPQCLAELADLGLSEGPAAFDSDSLWNYEAGLKTSFLNNRVTVNGSIYHIDWSDIQTTKILDCGYSFRENAGDATSQGAELEVMMRPVEGLFVSVGGSYTDATLSGDVPNLGGSKGDRIPYVPSLNLNAMMQYEFAVRQDLKGFVNFGVGRVGKTRTAFDPNSGYCQPGYSIGSLRLGMQRGHWEVALFVDNLWDERAEVLILPNVLRYPPGTETTRNRPRTAGLAFRFDL
jgi:iron complex outermembrane receptor protein